jgi:hypothetical protein
MFCPVWLAYGQDELVKEKQILKPAQLESAIKNLSKEADRVSVVRPCSNCLCCAGGKIIAHDFFIMVNGEKFGIKAKNACAVLKNVNFSVRPHNGISAVRFFFGATGRFRVDPGGMGALQLALQEWKC